MVVTVVKRLTEHQFPRRMCPTQNKCTTARWCMVCSKRDKAREALFYCQDCDVAVCVDWFFETYDTRKNDVMFNAYLLSTVCRELTFKVSFT
jgi:hypothetical protein